VAGDKRGDDGQDGDFTEIGSLGIGDDRRYRERRH
jgi:hypothetical protein